MKVNIFCPIHTIFFCKQGLQSCTGSTTGPFRPSPIKWRDSLAETDLLDIILQYGHLPLEEVIKKATENQHFREAILHSYLNLLHQLDAHEILIFIDGIKNTYMADEKTGQRIATGYDQSMTTLKTLGYNFKHLKIEMRGYTLAKNITEYIHSYCPNATHTILLQRHSNSENNFSFPNATNISLRYTKNFEDHIDLAAMFPQMTQLNLTNTDYQPYLNRNFTFLTNFIFSAQESHTSFQLWLDFLQSNKQLRSFESPILWNRNWLRLINEQLPNLESLTVEYQPKRNDNDGPVYDVIRFKSVKSFELKVMNFVDEWNVDARLRLATIQFEQLKSFTLASNIANTTDGWIEIIGRNDKLTSVQTKSFELNYNNLMRLTQLVKLKSISLECFDFFSVVDTLLFMEEKSTVKEIAVFTNSMGRGEFLTDLPANWKVVDDRTIDGKEYLFFVHN